MRFYVQYRLVCEFFALVNSRVKESSICVRYLSRKLDGGMVTICLFNKLRDFVSRETCSKTRVEKCVRKKSIWKTRSKSVKKFARHVWLHLFEPKRSERCVWPSTWLNFELLRKRIWKNVFKPPRQKGSSKKKERRKKKKTFEKVRAQLLFFALHNVTCQGFNCNWFRSHLLIALDFSRTKGLFMVANLPYQLTGQIFVFHCPTDVAPHFTYN